MTSQANTSEGSQQGLKEVINLLNLMANKEAKLYWIKAMVKLGELTQGQAGFIIINERLI